MVRRKISGFAHQRRSDRVGHRALVPRRPVPKQAIASTGGRLQHGSILAKRFADRGHMNLERIFADHGTRPYAIHQIVLGDQFIGRLNQDLDEFERARADGHRDTVRQ